eukprot:497204_1
MGNKNAKAKDSKSTARHKEEDVKSNATAVILVGNDMAGKSTVFRSIQFTHDPNSQKYIEDSKRYSDVILVNCIETMCLILEFCTILSEDCNLQECELVATGETVEHTELIRNFNMYSSNYDAQQKVKLGKAISFLWNSSPIQCTFAHAMKARYSDDILCTIQDNMDYFFNQANDIFAEEYTPTRQDMLHMRELTTGIIEFECKYGDKKYSFYDVGGRRSERQKWMHCFEENTGVIFVCALDGYCKKDWLSENLAIKESFALFKSVMSVKYMAHRPVVVFLNKTDLFKQSLLEISFKKCFEDYDGRVYGEFGNASVFDAMIAIYERDFHLEIPKNIQQLLGLYCAFLTCDYWFDLCYRDVIDFVTNKLMQIAPENVIKGVYETCAIEMNQIAKVVDNMLDLDVFKTI